MTNQIDIDEVREKMKRYTITQSGKEQTKWYKGWQLNSCHLAILNMLKRYDNGATINTDEFVGKFAIWEDTLVGLINMGYVRAEVQRL